MNFKNCKSYLRLLFTMIFCGVLLSACATAPQKEIKQAHAAYQKQNYGIAYHKLLKAAKTGNPKAEYSLGFLYFNGLGAPRDDMQAQIWMLKAADQKYAPAIRALKVVDAGPMRESFNTASAQENKSKTSGEKSKTARAKSKTKVAQAKHFSRKSMHAGYKKEKPMADASTAAKAKSKPAMHASANVNAKAKPVMHASATIKTKTKSKPVMHANTAVKAKSKPVMHANTTVKAKSKHKAKHMAKSPKAQSHKMTAKSSKSDKNNKRHAAASDVVMLPAPQIITR